MNYNYLLTYCDDLAANFTTTLAVRKFPRSYRRTNQDSLGQLSQYE